MKGSFLNKKKNNILFTNMKTRNYFLENLKLLKNSFKMHIYKNVTKVT